MMDWLVNSPVAPHPNTPEHLEDVLTEVFETLDNAHEEPYVATRVETVSGTPLAYVTPSETLGQYDLVVRVQSAHSSKQWRVREGVAFLRMARKLVDALANNRGLSVTVVDQAVAHETTDLDVFADEEFEMARRRMAFDPGCSTPVFLDELVTEPAYSGDELREAIEQAG